MEHKKTYYCPVCRAQRKIEFYEGLTWIHWLQILVIMTALTAALYPFFAFKTMLLVLPLVLFFEAWGRYQNRKRLVCDRCHFDPIYYKISPKEAVQIAREQITQIEVQLRKESPQYAAYKEIVLRSKEIELSASRMRKFEPNPLGKVPYRVPKGPGEVISKQVQTLN